jgi:hypothetical protein
VARGRMISKTLGSSRRFAELGRFPEIGEFAQALYPLCVTHADDFGRLPGDAFTIKHRIFPTSSRSEAVFDQALDLMEQVGLISLHNTGGHRVMVIDQFDSHQQGLHKRTKTKFDIPGDTEQAPTEAVTVSRGNERVSAFMEAFPPLYQEIMHQPYMQTRLQMERDLEAATALCAAYDQEALDRMVRLYLTVDEKNPKAKLIRGSQRTLPKLLTMAGSLADALGLTGGS